MARQVRIVIGAVRKFTAEVATRLTLNIVSNLITDTPKLTGWAAANWVPKIGEPFRGTAGTKAAAIAGDLDTATQQGGIASLITYRLDQGPIIVSNNTPYILKLNEGSSRKAPRLFIQAAVLRGIRQTSRIRGR